MRPKGFWSYAQADDKHLEGVLSDLRAKVAGEVSMLLGQDVDIFQDIRSLRIGDRWEERLRQEVTQATFLVPVLTPRYFTRPFCREETLTFLRIASEGGSEPRVFPIRFVEFDDEEGDDVRVALKVFQYSDFSKWRFENDPTRRAGLLNAFAKDVKEKLKTAAPMVRPTASKASAPVQEEPLPPAGQPAPEPPPVPVLTVDPIPGRAKYSSISDAIAAADPGASIVVRPGIYREALRVSKPLKLVGEGTREQVVVTTSDGSPLLCDAPFARVTGMTFRRESGGEDASVWITAGAVELEDCIMESGSLECVKISAATPTLRRCVMRAGAEIGLYVSDGARPIVEDCEMVGNKGNGVWVWGTGTFATLRRCVARNGSANGILFADGAAGLLERCESIGNAGAGISTLKGADPELRECILRANTEYGAFVSTEGRGRLENCIIEDNGRAGVEVMDLGAPRVVGCTIRSNQWEGIRISGKGLGTFADNDLRGNKDGPWWAGEGDPNRFEWRNNREI